MGTLPSLRGAVPPGGSGRSQEEDLAALPDWPVSAMETLVWSLTAWASTIGAVSGARAMAYVLSAYPVGHTAATPSPCGCTADGIPTKGGPTQRQLASRDHHMLAQQSGSTEMDEDNAHGASLQNAVGGQPPLAHAAHQPGARRSCRCMAARSVPCLVHAQPLAHPHDHGLGDYVRVFEIIQTQSNQIPPLQPRRLHEDGPNACPVNGPPALAEGVGLRMGQRVR